MKSRRGWRGKEGEERKRGGREEDVVEQFLLVRRVAADTSGREENEDIIALQNEPRRWTGAEGTLGSSATPSTSSVEEWGRRAG